jgi:crossover junction endodeoxyribonuclease RuvC
MAIITLMVRILGLDPGSRITGFGVVETGTRGIRYVASGCIRVGSGEMAGRLLEIHRHVGELIEAYAPGEIAIERAFVHRNADSALKLGQARGAALCGACRAGAPVFEYAPRAVKQTVTGTGAAEKSQVLHMIKALLALEGRLSADAADALAIAICHAQHRGTAIRRRGRNGR